MLLYNDKDKQMLDDKIDNMVKHIDNEKNNIFEPTIKVLKTIHELVFKFIRENKRKIYGGFAQNALIKSKDSKDAFYDESAIADIDFYSPNPIVDIMNLSNIFFENGYKNITGGEAQHPETYSIFVEFVNVCDISYVPGNIYHRTPYIEIDGLQYTHPSFVMIDMYRMLTDPYHSASHRWAKTFPRIITLQKHFPFKAPKGELTLGSFDNSKYKLVYNSIYTYLKNKDSIILIGHYAYNHFLNESRIKEDKKLGGKYKIYSPPYYQFVSTNYKDDVLKLLDILKKNHPDENILIEEHYPFWSFFGYSVYLKIGDTILCHVIHYNKRCVPVKQVKPLIFLDGKVEKDGDKDYIQIASFDYMLLNNMIYGLKGRVEKDEKKEHFHNVMTSQLIEMRNYYLEKNNKTMFDDTLFQEFLITCTGDTIEPKRESMLRTRQRFKSGKRPKFNYRPEDKVRPAETNYKFPNSSGNIINNPRNYRIMNDKYKDKLDDFDEEVVVDESENNTTLARSGRDYQKYYDDNYADFYEDY